MRQLSNNELMSVSAGCSLCKLISINVAMFNGTLLGMAVTWGLFAIPVSAPVAIGSGILTFAGTAYFSYYNVMD